MDTVANRTCWVNCRSLLLTVFLLLIAPFTRADFERTEERAPCDTYSATKQLMLCLNTTDSKTTWAFGSV